MKKQTKGGTVVKNAAGVREKICLEALHWCVGTPTLSQTKTTVSRYPISD